MTVIERTFSKKDLKRRNQNSINGQRNETAVYNSTSLIVAD
jgi:hypothetical protein